MRLPARPITRRRALTVFGAATGLSLLPALAAARPKTLHRWTGTALGAEASILLAHPDRDAAEALLVMCRDEIVRLEKVFSLHRDDSEVATLNRIGELSAPSQDLVQVLDDALRFGELSGGAFDITVQPLWRLYAEHFTRRPDDRGGPDPAELEKVLPLVDYRKVALSREVVRLAEPGMAITLNGIAQGYITDRVADLMRANGIGQVLLDLGEHRGLGRHPDGRPWQVAVVDPESGEALGEPIDLTNRAAATSGGYGTPFSRDGRHHHLFDPATGRSAVGNLQVTAIAPRAVTADVLSTALYVMPWGAAAELIAAIPAAGSIVVMGNGTTTRIGL